MTISNAEITVTKEINMDKKIIKTTTAPEAIGTYSQAVKVGNTVYLSGQIPLDPNTMTLVTGDFVTQTAQVFNNLRAVCEASGGHLSDLVKVNVYLTDMKNFKEFNDVMMQFFNEPYPARAAVQVASLPKGAHVEVEGVMVITDN